MDSRGVAKVLALLQLVLLGLPLFHAEPCADNPSDNIVQFTSLECLCCHDLDKFIQDHEYVHVLFYRAKGGLNIDINAKFEQLAAEWKWTRVHFARIDTDKDIDMAKKWSDPAMVPTNVMFKSGKPVMVTPKDFEQFRDRYEGNPEGQKWLITKYMGKDSVGSNLHYAVPVMSNKKLTKFTKKHEIAIVGFFKQENDLPHKTFSTAIWQLHQEKFKQSARSSYQEKFSFPGVGVACVMLQGVQKKEKAQVPSVAVYLDGKLVDDGKLLGSLYTPEKWTAKALFYFLREFLPDSAEDDVSTGKEEL